MNTVLREARKSKQREEEKTNIPTELTSADVESLHALTQLLEPVYEMTNEFQGDQLTANEVILGVINAVTGKCN